MKYAGIIRNDLAAAPGVSVSFFTQGCPHHCHGCHNPETWDFKGGKEFTNDTLKEIFEDIEANGIKRNFCVLGGEPLCEQNLLLTFLVISEVKKKFPDIKVYIWTGYYFNELSKTSDPKMKMILDMTDVIVDGPYIESLRDVTLPLRGSSNQSIIDLRENLKKS